MRTRVNYKGRGGYMYMYMYMYYARVYMYYTTCGDLDILSALSKSSSIFATESKPANPYALDCSLDSESSGSTI
jgi:hypothetical protein